MKKIVAIMWHGQYNLLKKIKEKFENRVDFKLYSSKLIDSGEQDVTEVIKELKSADLGIYYISATDFCFDEIEREMKDVPLQIVYLGSEGILRIKDEKTLMLSEKCNRYITYTGNENLENMINYLLSEALKEDVPYLEPIELSWDGIYYPDSNLNVDDVEEFFKLKGKSEKGVVGLITSRSYVLNGNDLPERQIIKEIEKLGFTVIPVYSYSIRNDEIGAKGLGYLVEKFFFDKKGNPVVDFVIKLSSFFFENVGDKNGDEAFKLLKRLNCPIMKPVVSSYLTVEEWEESKQGLTADIPWSVALPEFEGLIEPIIIGTVKREDGYEYRKPVQDRIEKLAKRIVKWISIKKKVNSDKKAVIVLNNSPCESAEANVGAASNLDTMQSVVNIMNHLKENGYVVEDIPEDGKALIKKIMEHKAISEFRWTTAKEIVEKGGALDLISEDEYLKWFAELPEDSANKVIKAWGSGVGECIDNVTPSMIYEGKIVISGLKFGNILLCTQPKRGCAGAKCNGAVCKILHDPSIPPTHQYIATYKYFEKKYKADVILHMGTHGNLEFLPGKGIGLSSSCFPDICAGDMPFIYIYNSDNPPEGTTAKRRGYATIVDHMQTAMTESGIYKDLEKLEKKLGEYDKVKFADPTQKHLLEHEILELICKSNLDRQLDVSNYHEDMDNIRIKVQTLIEGIKNSRIEKGQHIIGTLPEKDDRIEFLNAVLRHEGVDSSSIRGLLAKLIGTNLQLLMSKKGELNEIYNKINGTILFDLEKLSKNVITDFLKGKKFDESFNLLDYEIKNPDFIEKINGEREKVLDVNKRVDESQELDAILKGMNANFIAPGPGGVMTRGGDDILPTGRNFYSLDPNLVPTKSAYEVGKRLADGVIEKFLNEEGRYPENFAMYWMANDIMWGNGEGMGQLMYLMGVKPKWLPNGRVKGFEIIPIDELNRPRIDVTVKITSILRDNFPKCMELIDEAVSELSKLNEPNDRNYIKKHTEENMKSGLNFKSASSRIFGARPGTYVTGVNLAIYASSWKDKKDLADIFTYYNGYVYGKDKRGEEDYKALQSNFKTVDITYNKVISDEHDLLGCCCYFGNHGGMTAAVRQMSGHDIKTYYGDTREVTNVEIRTLADELRRVVRTKLLNPKWIEGQKEHGYKGAQDISKKVGRIYGWDATTDEVDDWIFDDITKTFIMDEENNKFFMENNPWAFEEMNRRLLEAFERKLWKPQDEKYIQVIKDNYLQIEGFMEENMGNDMGDFQGGSIDMIGLDEMKDFSEEIDKMKEKLK